MSESIKYESISDNEQFRVRRSRLVDNCILGYYQPKYRERK